jgi:hypothetical protein
MLKGWWHERVERRRYRMCQTGELAWHCHVPHKPWACLACNGLHPLGQGIAAVCVEGATCKLVCGLSGGRIVLVGLYPRRVPQGMYHAAQSIFDVGVHVDVNPQALAL